LIIDTFTVIKSVVERIASHSMPLPATFPELYTGFSVFDPWVASFHLSDTPTPYCILVSASSVLFPP
jgi:hypothetical protein